MKQRSWVSHPHHLEVSVAGDSLEDRQRAHEAGSQAFSAAKASGALNGRPTTVRNEELRLAQEARGILDDGGYPELTGQARAKAAENVDRQIAWSREALEILRSRGVAD
jgi:hypothetical protein